MEDGGKYIEFILAHRELGSSRRGRMVRTLCRC